MDDNTEVKKEETTTQEATDNTEKSVPETPAAENNEPDKDTEAEEKPPRRLTKYEQEQEKKNKLKNDKKYKRNRLMYDFSTLVLFALLIINGIRYFLGIELIINGAIYTQYYFILYLIPCIVMIISLIRSKKIAKEFDVNEGNAGLIIVSGLTVFLTIITILNILSPSYHIYTAEDIEIKSGEKMTLVNYVNVPAFTKPRETMPSEHSVDVYKPLGIFSKRIATAYVLLGDTYIEIDEDSGEYLLTIESIVKSESIPFKY